MLGADPALRSALTGEDSFYVLEQEAAVIQERMEQIGVARLSACLRKMEVDGCIIHLDVSGVQEMVRLLRICSKKNGV